MGSRPHPGRLRPVMVKAIHLCRFQDGATPLLSSAPGTIVDLVRRFFLRPATAMATIVDLFVVVLDQAMARDFRQVAVVPFFAGRSSLATGPFRRASDFVPFQTGSVIAIVAAGLVGPAAVVVDLAEMIAAVPGSVDPAIGRSVSFAASAVEVAAWAFLLDVFLAARSSL